VNSYVDLFILICYSSVSFLCSSFHSPTLKRENQLCMSLHVFILSTKMCSFWQTVLLLV